jgi:hypothetical protein
MSRLILRPLVNTPILSPSVKTRRANHTTHYIAVGAHLARYKFSLKTSPPSKFDPNLGEPIQESLLLEALQSSKEWDIGVKYAEAQNLARTVRIRHYSA